MKKKYASCLLFAVLSVTFFYLSAMFWGELSRSKERLMCTLSEPVSENQASLLMEQYLEQLQEDLQADGKKQPLEFCIWGQKEEVSLTNENLSRSVPADVIIFCGSLELLFEACRTPSWDDQQGCLLDEEAAWMLFGSVAAEGKEIILEEQRYTVRKVISGKNGIAVIPARSSKIQNGMPKKAENGQEEGIEEKILHRVTIKRTKNQSVSGQQAAWISQFGLPCDLLDLEFLRGICGFCVLLMPVAASSMFLYQLWKMYRKQELWRPKMVLLGILLLFAALILLQFQKWLQIPDDYIPARWSEFEFWSQLLKQKEQAVRLLFSIPKTVLDYAWIGSFLKGAATGISCFFCGVFLLMHLKIADCQEA